MNQEQLNQIADLIAKSLEDWVPEAVDAAVEARLKEINLSENTDIKEIKSQLKELVEKAKFWAKWDEDLTEAKELFVNALKGLRNWDLSWVKAMNTSTPADWGYLVHPEFEKGVFRIMGNYWIWKDCSISRMKSDTKYFTVRNEWVQVFYTDQASQYQDTALSYERKQMIAKKVGAILSSTYELIEDEPENFATPLNDGTYLFATTTCPNCRMAKTFLAQANIEFSEIIANDNVDLTKQLGVTVAPTLIIVKNGALVEKVENVSNIRAFIEQARA